VVRGAVRHLELLGGETLVHVAPARQQAPVVARMEPAQARALRIGETVALAAPAARVLVFDASGARLERDTDASRPTASVGAPAGMEAARG
jgi:multiple sugar transport system ATP-binding protein